MTVYLPEQRLLRKRDLSTGYDSGTDDHRAVLPSSSSTQMITCWLGPMDGKEEQQCEGSKITIRASGTEPKIKLYLESWDKDQDKAREGAKAVLRVVRVSLSSASSIIGHRRAVCTNITFLPL